jgi:hypothetical protein
MQGRCLFGRVTDSHYMEHGNVNTSYRSSRGSGSGIAYQTQVWPVHLNLQSMTPCTANSTSASSKTMNGAFPPSSKLTFFNVSVASFASIFPTFVEPVKLILATNGLVASSVAASRSLVVHTWMHFAGIPASMASFVSARQECGVSLGGLMTTEQPAASAGPTLRVIMAAGKFHLLP